MNVLLKLPKLNNNNNVAKLTSFYNAIESNIRSLMTMGLNPSHYGPLLIPVILERLPDSIKLIVTRKLGQNNRHISDFINCIKEEVDARENCGFIKDKIDYEHLRNTTHSLLGVEKHWRKNCVFCGKLHYSDKCQNVIDVSIRKKIFRNEKRCFRCLMTGHILKNCRVSYKCSNCRGKNHYTSIYKTLLISKIKKIVLTIMKKIKRKWLC